MFDAGWRFGEVVKDDATGKSVQHIYTSYEEFVADDTNLLDIAEILHIGYINSSAILSGTSSNLSNIQIGGQKITVYYTPKNTGPITIDNDDGSSFEVNINLTTSEGTNTPYKLIKWSQAANYIEFLSPELDLTLQTVINKALSEYLLKSRRGNMSYLNQILFKLLKLTIRSAFAKDSKKVEEVAEDFFKKKTTDFKKGLTKYMNGMKINDNGQDIHLFDGDIKFNNDFTNIISK